MNSDDTFSDTRTRDEPARDLAPISIKAKIATFWPQLPALWFAHFESILGPQKRSDLERFNCVIPQLDQAALQEVGDIILQPPTHNKYEAVKNRLISVFGETETQQLRKLLHETELGNDRPSQLMRRMRTLGNGKIPDSTLRIMWLGHLPATIRMVLSVNTESHLDVLASMADQMMESTAAERQEISAVEQQNDTRRQMATIEKQLNELTNQISRMQQNRIQPEHIEKPRYRPTQTICYYHSRFGNAAKKCQKPCEYHVQGRQSENC